MTSMSVEMTKVPVEMTRVPGEIAAGPMSRSPGATISTESTENNLPAGYSGTPLPRKLGIKQGHTVFLVGAPDGFESVLGELPEPVSLRRVELPLGEDNDIPDIVVLFVQSVAALKDGFEVAAPASRADAAIWVAWPKRSSGIESDMTEDRVRGVALPRGMVDNKVCAIDETWSGLRLVVRKENRAGWPGRFFV